MKKYRIREIKFGDGSNKYIYQIKYNYLSLSHENDILIFLFPIFYTHYWLSWDSQWVKTSIQYNTFNDAERNLHIDMYDYNYNISEERKKKIKQIKTVNKKSL